MRNKILVLGILACMMPALAACSGGKKTPETQAQTAAPETVVEVDTMADDNGLLDEDVTVAANIDENTDGTISDGWSDGEPVTEEGDSDIFEP